MEQINILQLQNFPIYDQLKLEEGLLRTHHGNWCLINFGTPPAIVMGISAKAEQVIDLEHLNQHPLPVIRRFTGGGTVVVDHNTCFITFICNTSSTQTVPFPQHVHEWASILYQQVFAGHGFSLRENDYVIGDLKCGGNAQYMQKGRWLHHTSFLWDYDPSHMRYLKMPPKMPAYRQQRSHEAFLCRLSDHVASSNHLLDGLRNHLPQRFELRESDLATALDSIAGPHRSSTEYFLQRLGDVTNQTLSTIDPKIAPSAPDLLLREPKNNWHL